MDKGIRLMTLMLSAVSHKITPTNTSIFEMQFNTVNLCLYRGWTCKPTNFKLPTSISHTTQCVYSYILSEYYNLKNTESAPLLLRL